MKRGVSNSTKNNESKHFFMKKGSKQSPKTLMNSKNLEIVLNKKFAKSTTKSKKNYTTPLTISTAEVRERRHQSRKGLTDIN